MAGKRALVVDDEKLIVKGIRFSLEQDEMQVDCAYDGEEALEYARNNQYDIILLDYGADDYITKPFNILEVKARIKAIMRRIEPKRIMGEEPFAKTVESGELRLDCEGRRAYIAGAEVGLTAKEFEVLELLMLNPDRVYSRENLLQLVWGADYPGDVRTVDVHIRRLREKVEKNPSEPRYVHTKWGVGYYFQNA